MGSKPGPASAGLVEYPTPIFIEFSIDETDTERCEMKNKTSGTKKISAVRGRGRPQTYPLTGQQVRSIQSRLAKGISVAKIATELDVHEFAVLRIKRGSEN